MALRWFGFFIIFQILFSSKLLCAAINPDAKTGSPEASCQKVVENSEIDILWDRAKAFHRESKGAEVLGVIQEILKLNPHHEKAVSLKAKIFTDQSRLNEALVVIEDGLTFAAGNSVFWA